LGLFQIRYDISILAFPLYYFVPYIPHHDVWLLLLYPNPNIIIIMAFPIILHFATVVMGMASGYGLAIYQQFVGSLRATNFAGSIILGVSADVQPDVIDYLTSMNVVMKYIESEGAVCTYNGTVGDKGVVIDMQKSDGEWHFPKGTYILL